MRTFPFSRKIPWYLPLIFLLLLIATSSAGYLYYQGQKKQIKKEKLNELLAIADLKVGQIVDWRKERLGDATTIFDNFFLAPHVQYLIRNPSSSKGKKEIFEWMESFKKSYRYGDIFLVDREGAVLLSDSGDEGAIDPETKRLASMAMERKTVVFSDLYRAGVNGKIILSLAVPVLARWRDTSFPIGVIFLRMSPSDFLYPLIRSWPTPSRSAETMLVRSEGNDVLYLNELRYRAGAALTLRVPIVDQGVPAAAVASGREGIFEGLDYRGITVLAAVRSIPGSSWALVSKVDAEEVYAPVRSRLWDVMLVIVLCIISAGGGVILIWRKQEEREQRKYREYLEETVKERTAELEMVNRHLEASYRDMESFSYSVSHDLRTPLIAIRGFSGKLYKEYADRLDDRGRDLLDIVSGSAGKMEHLINDLLAFSRVSAREINHVRIDTGDLVREVVEELKLTLGERTVKVEIRNLPSAFGDPSMIRQVFSNLLSNALKFTEPKKNALIEVGGSERTGDQLYYVKDNGIGFEMKQGDRLFSIFQRLHDEKEFAGTGVGLAIVKRIIEKHGGTVWAEGRPGEGAIFSFTLPKKAVTG